MMRRIVIALLAAALVLSLAGCAFVEAPGSKEEDRARLQALLNEISGNVQSGKGPITAGLAVEFLSWAGSTSLTREETAQVAADWLAAQTPELRRAAEEKLNGLLGQMNKLLTDGAEKVKDSGWDFQSILQDILASGGL